MNPRSRGGTPTLHALDHEGAGQVWGGVRGEGRVIGVAVAILSIDLGAGAGGSGEATPTCGEFGRPRTTTPKLVQPISGGWATRSGLLRVCPPLRVTSPARPRRSGRWCWGGVGGSVADRRSS